MTKLLIIDDEAPFLRALAISLQARGYKIEAATTGKDGLEVASRTNPDVILLDLGLPDLSGIDVLRELRTWSMVPVIVLSARHSEATKVDALDAGADDYVTKPFGMDELLARLRAAARRPPMVTDDPPVVTEHFTVDLSGRHVTMADGSSVRLTRTEWNVLDVLIRHRNKLVSQKQLLQEAWGPEYGTETDYVRSYLAAIRRKLEPDSSHPRYFVTEPGLGYRFTG